MKKIFVLVLILAFGFILTGCPPRKVVLPEPPKPVVTPEEIKEKAVEVKPEVKPQVRPEVKPEVKITEQPLVKAEPKEVEAPKYIEEKVVFKFEDIHFDFDKYDIRPDAKPTLKTAADWMLKNPAAKILIEGHCCEIGTNEYNLALGDRRAKAAKDYLIALGVTSGRIEMVSYGEERPFCTESKAEECLKKNRRAHFVILKEITNK
ncbi:MAG: peptidoglycan-associated lipoprotein Pal [Thermodesulfovibrionales bacterium]|nr:peptidoglycan-associated lipoprotein Pal [Thermodesulfovibrionales bacterium]